MLTSLLPGMGRNMANDSRLKLFIRRADVQKEVTKGLQPSLRTTYVQHKDLAKKSVLVIAFIFCPQGTVRHAGCDYCLLCDNYQLGL